MSRIESPEQGFARLRDPGEWDLTLVPRAHVFPAARPRRPLVRWSVWIVSTAAVVALALIVGFGIRDLRHAAPPAVPPVTTSPTPSPSDPTLSPEGLGPLHLGEPVPADNGIVVPATLQCGTPTWQSTQYDGGIGFHLAIVTADLADRGSDVTKIALTDDLYPTSWGVRVGDSETQLQEAVPDATITENGLTRVYTLITGDTGVQFIVATEQSDTNHWTKDQAGTIAYIVLFPAGSPPTSWNGLDGNATCD